MPSKAGSIDLSIVIPALNEAENLKALLPNIESAAQKLELEYEILIVAGGSSDDARAAAEHSSHRVKVISQTKKGYGSALAEGFLSAKGDYILTMDADLSHDPSFLSTFWSARNQAELIIGSRYVSGGTADMPVLRRLLSRVLNLFFRIGLSMSWKDLSSGFRLYRTSITRDLKLESTDFDVLQEILIQSYANGCTVAEIPIHYKPRGSGVSHAKLIRFGIAYLRTFWRMWNLRNSIRCADYDDRAYDSRIPLQRYWQRRRYSIIESFGSDRGSVLDIGCGSSRILLSSIKPVGVDILLNKLRYARKFGRPLVRASIFSLPFANQSFECVVCSEVIEHIEPGIQPFLEMKRILKPNGILILGTPDYDRFIWRWIERIYGVIVPGGYADEHITHYSFRSLKELVESLGFRVEHHRYIFWSELILRCSYSDAAKQDNAFLLASN